MGWAASSLASSGEMPEDEMEEAYDAAARPWAACSARVISSSMASTSASSTTALSDSKTRLRSSAVRTPSVRSCSVFYAGSCLASRSSSESSVPSMPMSTCSKRADSRFAAMTYWRRLRGSMWKRESSAQ